MKFRIKVTDSNGQTGSWIGEPDYYSLSRALEKCEIKSFEISQIPYQQ